jgi:lysophospholipase L1-like esterase
MTEAERPESMTKIVLIGDSIRMGYQRIVESELGEHLELWAPAKNSRNSERVRDHLQPWILDQKPDLVHLNCGLHDIKVAFGATAHAIGIGAYRYNLECIMDATLQASARLIWASTTPVNHAWHHANKDFDRYEADVRAYNEVAAEVATSRGVQIDDLYAVVMQAGRDDLLLPDGVHFRPQGYQLLGKAVAQAIHLALG